MIFITKVVAEYGDIYLSRDKKCYIEILFRDINTKEMDDSIFASINHFIILSFRV